MQKFSCISAHAQTLARARTDRQTDTHTHTYTHTRAHAHAHTHTHTHTHKAGSRPGTCTSSGDMWNWKAGKAVKQQRAMPRCW